MNLFVGYPYTSEFHIPCCISLTVGDFTYCYKFHIGELIACRQVTKWQSCSLILFIYLGFYVAFNTVQVISRRVVGRAEETST